MTLRSRGYSITSTWNKINSAETSPADRKTPAFAAKKASANEDAIALIDIKTSIDQNSLANQDALRLINKNALVIANRNTPVPIDKNASISANKNALVLANRDVLALTSKNKNASVPVPENKDALELVD